MKEGSSSQDHRQFTGVVRVIHPTPLFDVVGMEPTREPHDPLPGLTPHPAHTHTQYHKIAMYVLQCMWELHIIMC